MKKLTFVDSFIVPVIASRVPCGEAIPDSLPETSFFSYPCEGFESNVKLHEQESHLSKAAYRCAQTFARLFQHALTHSGAMSTAGQKIYQRQSAFSASQSNNVRSYPCEGFESNAKLHEQESHLSKAAYRCAQTFARLFHRALPYKPRGDADER